MMLLLRHTMARLRNLLLIMGLMLAGFQVVLVANAASIHKSGGFQQMAVLIPEFLRELMGPSITAFLSFGGIVSLGYFHLVVLSALVGLAIAVGTIPAAEVESGFIDL